jgi:hypothetical protein
VTLRTSVVNGFRAQKSVCFLEACGSKTWPNRQSTVTESLQFGRGYGNCFHKEDDDELAQCPGGTMIGLRTKGSSGHGSDPSAHSIAYSLPPFV